MDLGSRYNAAMGKVEVIGWYTDDSSEAEKRKLHPQRETCGYKKLVIDLLGYGSASHYGFTLDQKRQGKTEVADFFQKHEIVALLMKGIDMAMEMIDARERQFIKAYYGLYAPAKTQEEIGRALEPSVPSSRVGAAIAKGLRKLRHRSIAGEYREFMPPRPKF